MLGDTTEHQLSLHWKEMRRQGQKDFSKFSFTGVNLKESLPGMQNWATAWQRKYLMQPASKKNPAAIDYTEHLKSIINKLEQALMKSQN